MDGLSASSFGADARKADDLYDLVKPGRPAARMRRIRPFGGRTFTVGEYFWRDAYPFVGLLADVRIYDRALAPDQVFRAAAEWLGPP